MWRKHKDRITQLNRKLAQQAGEREQALQQLQALQASLEQQVEKRTAALSAAIEVGRAAASILEMETLTHRMVHLVREKFELDYVGLYLVDGSGRYAILRADAGAQGHRIQERGNRFEIGGQSPVGSACKLFQPRISQKVEQKREHSACDNCSVMALPLLTGDHLVGALETHSTRPEAFGDEELSVLKLVADQLALAVDNALKFSTEAALLEATSPLYRANRTLAAATTVDDIVRAIIGVVASTEADGCAVAAFDSPASSSPVPARTGAGRTGPQRGESNDQREMVTFLRSWDRRGASRFPTGVPMKTEATHLPLSTVSTFWAVDDVTRETDIPEQARKSLARLGNRALVNVPLRSGDQVTGFVLVYRAEAGPFSPAAIRLYEALVDQAAAALERAHLLEEARRRAAHDRLLREIASRTRQTLDMETMLQTAADEIYQALGLDEVVIRLATDEEESVQLTGKGNGDGYMG
jgi:GAF domain-containing protein